MTYIKHTSPSHGQESSGGRGGQGISALAGQSGDVLFPDGGGRGFSKWFIRKGKMQSEETICSTTLFQVGTRT